MITNADITIYHETYNKETRLKAVSYTHLDVYKRQLYWFDVYSTLYRLAPAGAFEPSVTYGDSIFEDTGVEYSRRKAMADSKYIRPELLTSWYFGVSEEEAKAMLPEPETPENILFGSD